MKHRTPTVEASVERRDDGTIALVSRHVGLWREAPATGASVRAGDALGRLEVLGVLHTIRVPAGAAGFVVERGGDDGLARRPVQCGQVLVVLDPEAMPEGAVAAEVASSSTGGLFFGAPSSGRFYGRPAPDQEPFVKEGDIIDRGRVVAIIEIMKTFHRVAYEGAALPARAKILRIVPADGDDLEQGDPLLELEAAP